MKKIFALGATSVAALALSISPAMGASGLTPPPIDSPALDAALANRNIANPITSPTGAAPTGAELIPGVQGGVASKFTVSQLGTSIGQQLRAQGWSLISSSPGNESASSVNTPASAFGGALNGVTMLINEISATSVPKIKFVATNYYGNSSLFLGQVAAPNDILVHTSAQLASGDMYPATWGGDKYGRVQSLGIAVSDEVPINITANVGYNVRAYCGVTGNSLKCPGSGQTIGGSTGDSPSSAEGAAAEDAVDSGTIGASGYTSYWMPQAILGFTGATPAKSLACAGDSIVMTQGDPSGVRLLLGGFCTRIADQILTPAGTYPAITPAFGFVNIARAGETVATFLTAAQNRVRLQIASFATTVLSDGMTNDLDGTSAVSVFEARKIAEAMLYLRQGQKFIGTTLIPKTTSTDNWRTVANQTFTNAAAETQREAYNVWMRDGTSTGFVAQTLAAATAAGLINPKVAMFDMAATVEVNASNVLTPNGGYWIAPIGQSAAYSGTVTTVSANTAQIVDSALSPTTQNYYRGYMAILTGGNGAGLSAAVENQNSTINKIQTAGFNSYTQAVGDTYQLWQTIATPDGIHPGPWAAARIAASFNTSLVQ